MFIVTRMIPTQFTIGNENVRERERDRGHDAAENIVFAHIAEQALNEPFFPYSVWFYFLFSLFLVQSLVMGFIGPAIKLLYSLYTLYHMLVIFEAIRIGHHHRNVH